MALVTSRSSSSLRHGERRLVKSKCHCFIPWLFSEACPRAHCGGERGRNRSLSPLEAATQLGDGHSPHRTSDCQVKAWGSPKWPEGLRMPGPGRERPGEAEDFVTEEVTSWIQKDGHGAGRTRHDRVTSVLSPSQMAHARVKLTLPSVASPEPAYSR